MNRSKKIYILLGMLACVSTAAFAVTRMEEQKEKIKNSGEVILSIDADAVNSLSWECEGERFSFRRKDAETASPSEAGTAQAAEDGGSAADRVPAREAEWIYEGDEAFPVDAEKIAERLELFSEFAADFAIEEAEDFGQYGLAKPVCTIRIAAGEENYEISLGDFSSMDAQRYVSIGDGRAYLVKDDPFPLFNVTLDGLIRHDEIPALSDAVRIEFSGAEAYSIASGEEVPGSHREEDRYFVQQEDGALPLDTERVESYLNGISNLEATDYVSYQASAEDLSKYGLNDPVLTVKIVYPKKAEDGTEKEAVFSFSVGRDPKEREAAERKEKERETQGDAEAEASDDASQTPDAMEETVTAYLRIGESELIYRITPETYRALTGASADDFRHRELLPAAFSGLDSIELTLEGKSHVITAEGRGEKKRYLFDGEEIEIDRLREAFEALTAERFLSEAPEGKEELRVLFTLSEKDGEAQRAETELVLSRYDGESCLAVIDGTPEALVSRSAVVELIEAVHALTL